MKNIINKKMFLGILVGLVLGVTVNAYATTNYNSNQILYQKGDSNITLTEVLDDLNQTVISSGGITIPKLYLYSHSNFGAQSSAGSNGSHNSSMEFVFDVSTFNSFSIGGISGGTITITFTYKDDVALSQTKNGSATYNETAVASKSYDLSLIKQIKLASSINHSTWFNTDTWGGGSFTDSYTLTNVNFK